MPEQCNLVNKYEDIVNLQGAGAYCVTTRTACYFLVFLWYESMWSDANKLWGRPPQYAPAPCVLDLWLFDLESGVRVTCDVGYLCDNFSLPRPLCSRLMPDVRDRQTSDAHHRLMPPRLGGGGTINWLIDLTAVTLTYSFMMLPDNRRGH